jgi:hypothetical protein
VVRTSPYPLRANYLHASDTVTILEGACQLKAATSAQLFQLSQIAKSGHDFVKDCLSKKTAGEKLVSA